VSLPPNGNEDRHFEEESRDQVFAPGPHLRPLAVMHLFGLLALAAVLAVVSLRISGVSTGMLSLSVAIWAAFDLALFLYLRSTAPERLSQQTQIKLVHAQIIVDLTGLTVLLHLSGTVANPFSPFYVFPVILAAALLTRRAALGYAAVASLLYCGLLLAEAVGWLPNHCLIGISGTPPYPRDALLIAQGLALAGMCFLTAAATTALVGALRSRARELATSRQRAELRAAEMQELNQRLQAANEEYLHGQQHLDGLYAELQQAYARLEARSRHMSELNEQLRAANAECKLRGEQLAEVNIRLHEANLRLESRSEHMKELNEQLRAANADCRAKRDELVEVNARLATANAKLRELEDMRAQFTLLVTHELRAPVAAIQSYLKLILEGYVPEAKVRETLAKAEKRAMEQLALIADLLELSRIGSADARGQVQPVQIELSLQEQIDLLAGGARERGITVEANIAVGLPPVLTNPDQIRSLWNNLISNAIKYNRDGGRVDIALRREGDRVIASVGDTGIGIPPEAMPRLFSEFFRADNAKALSRMGTGLGLSIVKEIVERSGGAIVAESELDKGTTFRLWLPMLGAGGAKATPAGEVAAPEPAAA